MIYTYKPQLTNAQKEELGREARLCDRVAYDTRQWSQALDAASKDLLPVGFLIGFAESLDKSQQALFDYQFRDLREGFPEILQSATV